MTTGERLQQLSSLSGVSASVMLAAIGSGATTGEALVNYSGLATGTAAEHLLTDARKATSSDAGGRARRAREIFDDTPIRTPPKPRTPERVARRVIVDDIELFIPKDEPSRVARDLIRINANLDATDEDDLIAILCAIAPIIEMERGR